MSSIASNTEGRLEELLLLWEEIYEQGQNLPAEELCQDCPELMSELQRRINALLKMEGKFGATGEMDSSHESSSERDSEPEVPKLSGKLSLQSTYSVLRQHASGGLGEVYLAHDSALQREVAIKTLKAICEKFPDRKGRFLREAQLTGQLEHPGIVPVYGLGNSPDGQPLYAMRFIRGESLEDELREYHSAGRKSSGLRKLLRHLVSACRTVHYAHTRRVLHCDIKPMNIMVGKFGETFVLDWGEAVVVNPHTLATEGPVPAASSIEENTDSPAGGTVPYMPPERVDGSATMLDATSDVYSLGATLYKVLTGRDAFRATSRPQLIDKIRRGDFPHPREVNSHISRSLAEITLKAMAANRDDRYQNAGAMADDLQAWMDDEPISLRRERWAEWAGRMMRRHRAAAMGIFFGLLSVVVATTLLAVSSRQNLKEVEAEREASRSRGKTGWPPSPGSPQRRSSRTSTPASISLKRPPAIRNSPVGSRH
ncbi:MAG: serine/threonine-protein kinase [Planctomycetaceae bacterium]